MDISVLEIFYLSERDNVALHKHLLKMTVRAQRIIENSL